MKNNEELNNDSLNSKFADDLLKDTDLNDYVETIKNKKKKSVHFISKVNPKIKYRIRATSGTVGPGNYKNDEILICGESYNTLDQTYSYSIKTIKDIHIEYIDLDCVSKGDLSKICKKNQGMKSTKDRDYFVDLLKIIFGVPEKKNKTPEEIKEILLQNKQIILQGPPGTGKTRLAKILAAILIQPENTKENSNQDRKTDQDNNIQKIENDCLKTCENELKKSNGRIKLVQFHPSYGYEDFIMGVSVNTKDGHIVMGGKKGAIKEFADWISNEDKPYNKFVLIIDEINRAPIGTVMGELLYALEKRGEKIQIQSADEKDTTLSIPDNLYIIGTMNTADKSLTSMDYAMRRRFAFVNVYSYIPKVKYFDRKLYGRISSLFKHEVIVDGINPEDIMLGTSYFINDFVEETKEYKDKKEYKVKYEIVPILREYYKDGYFKKNKKIGEQSIKEIMKSNERLIEYLTSEEEGQHETHNS